MYWLATESEFKDYILSRLVMLNVNGVNPGMAMRLVEALLLAD